MFIMFILLIMIKQNTCSDLQKTRKNTEEKGDKHMLLESKHAKT